VEHEVWGLSVVYSAFPQKPVKWVDCECGITKSPTPTFKCCLWEFDSSGDEEKSVWKALTCELSGSTWLYVCLRLYDTTNGRQHPTLHYIRPACPNEYLTMLVPLDAYQNSPKKIFD